MAEAAVATVINKAVEIGANALLQAGSRVYNLAENISWIESQMRTLQSYLKDAEDKKAASQEVANLIISIRDLAQDVEDILDTYLPKIESHNTKGSASFLCYCVTTNSFALKIEKIKKRAADLEVSKTNCCITIDPNAGTNADVDVWRSRKLFLRARESKLIGREQTLGKLEAEMLSKTMLCRIASVVGPAGVGKTTVAKRIYQKVKDGFESSAIVYVSQEPKVGELLLDIAKQVGLSEDKMKENLEDNLHSFLLEKRYVIFLDDIWDFKTWDRLRDVLAYDSEKGSRIIVTSRYTDVGRYIGGESSLIPLSLLTENEGKELFFDLFLPSSEEPLPPALIDIGEKIVERCGGLPLAIVVAVGMLKSRERSKQAWNEVLKSLSQGAENDCLKILALSYQDLPTELKPLFLYFGIFPEDHEVLVSDLTHMWVAEKFIPVDGSRMPYGIVEANINKLISRNLIQVSRRRSDGRVRSCHIHDLLHNLCIQVAEENNFFCTQNKLQSVGFSSIVRRVTTSPGSLSKHAFENFRFPRKLRALLCFSEDEELFIFMKRNASHLRFLRLLTIEVEGRETLSLNEIPNLSGLIHLKLKGVFIKRGFSNLKKLETLELISARVPDSILKIKHLKHFLLNEVTIVQSFPTRIYHKYEEHGVELALQNLETLDWDLKRYFLKPSSIKKLPNLRKLHTSMVATEKRMFEVLSDTTPVLQKLEDLKLQLDLLWNYVRLSTDLTRDLPRLDLSRYKYLVKLQLVGHMWSESWRNPMLEITVEFPPNLVKITLIKLSVTANLMESLKGLEKLEIIKLKRCSAGKLDFSGEHNFPQLQVLMLCDTEFKELVVDENGMPKLDTFIYQPSWGTRVIPERLAKMISKNYDNWERLVDAVLRREQFRQLALRNSMSYSSSSSASSSFDLGSGSSFPSYGEHRIYSNVERLSPRNYQSWFTKSKQWIKKSWSRATSKPTSAAQSNT